MYSYNPTSNLYRSILASQLIHYSILQSIK